MISVEDVAFAYRRGRPVLDIARFEVGGGERVFLRGPSGSGKSTLLGLVAGVLDVQTGVVRVAGEDLAKLSGPRRDALRAEKLGVVFQLFNLLPFLSVIENVVLPCRFSAARKAAAQKAGGTAEAEARRLLSRLGLPEDLQKGRAASDLSVGQQQRVAVARALIGSPSLILADEPTSALDADSREAFVDLLASEAARSGASLVFVSHDASLASRFDRAEDLGALNRAWARGAAS